MSLFGGRKKDVNSPVWRNRAGEIVCPGDRCPQKKCDDTCPIWLSTIAASMCATGEYQAALPLLEKAASTAPDFYDARNNMAAIYGQLGDYQKAYDAYFEAHKIKPEKYQPVYGLAWASCDLKQYEECLRWCDEYDRLNRDHGCDEARKKANEALKRDAAQEEEIVPFDDCSRATICQWLLDEGEKEGFIKDATVFPNIPEIMIEARPVSLQMLSGMLEAVSKDYLYTFNSMWVTYAAMGAVKLWYDDWDALQKKGIYAALTEHNDVTKIPSFVFELIGWKNDKKKTEHFGTHIVNLATIAIKRLTALYKVTPNIDKNAAMEGYTNLLMAFYDYGMIIEMNELGMD